MRKRKEVIAEEVRDRLVEEKGLDVVDPSIQRVRGTIAESIHETLIQEDQKFDSVEKVIDAMKKDPRTILDHITDNIDTPQSQYVLHHPLFWKDIIRNHLRYFYWIWQYLPANLFQESEIESLLVDSCMQYGVRYKESELVTKLFEDIFSHWKNWDPEWSKDSSLRTIFQKKNFWNAILEQLSYDEAVIYLRWIQDTFSGLYTEQSFFSVLATKIDIPKNNQDEIHDDRHEMMQKQWQKILGIDRDLDTIQLSRDKQAKRKIIREVREKISTMENILLHIVDVLEKGFDLCRTDRPMGEQVFAIKLDEYNNQTVQEILDQSIRRLPAKELQQIVLEKVNELKSGGMLTREDFLLWDKRWRDDFEGKKEYYGPDDKINITFEPYAFVADYRSGPKEKRDSKFGALFASTKQDKRYMAGIGVLKDGTSKDHAIPHEKQHARHFALSPWNTSQLEGTYFEKKTDENYTIELNSNSPIENKKLLNYVRSHFHEVMEKILIQARDEILAYNSANDLLYGYNLLTQSEVYDYMHSDKMKIKEYVETVSVPSVVRNKIFELLEGIMSEYKRVITNIGYLLVLMQKKNLGSDEMIWFPVFQLAALAKKYDVVKDNGSPFVKNDFSPIF